MNVSDGVQLTSVRFVTQNSDLSITEVLVVHTVDELYQTTCMLHTPRESHNMSYGNEYKRLDCGFIVFIDGFEFIIRVMIKTTMYDYNIVLKSYNNVFIISC